MKHNTPFLRCAALAAPVLFFFSCATDIAAVKPVETAAVSTPVDGTDVKPIEPEYAAARPIEAAAVLPLPEGPLAGSVPEYIMGSGLMEAELMAEFLLAANPKGDRDFVYLLAQHYVKEAAVEGINHDVAFVQMCLETGYLKYGGLVTPDMNNFCGLGAISAEQPGERFPDALIGVRAHIQHLKVYASEEPLKQELVDPRYRYVRPGSSPKIEGLAGTWAADRQYAVKIRSILEKLYQFSPEDI